jgi:hypothetical protein
METSITPPDGQYSAVLSLVLAMSGKNTLAGNLRETTNWEFFSFEALNKPSLVEFRQSIASLMPLNG